MIQGMTVGGDVLGAGSAEYESARRSQIARVDGVRPLVTVRCRVPEDGAMNEVSVSDGTVTVGAGARRALPASTARSLSTKAAAWRANRRDPQGAVFTVSQLVISSQGA
jgi:hypothetical protein